MRFNPKQLFKRFPELEEIANRLDESEKKTKEKNDAISKKPSEFTEGMKPKRIPIYHPEHCVISDTYNEGRWDKTPYTPKPGKEAFLQDIAKAIEGRKAEGIRIKIYNGKLCKGEPVYKTDVYFIEDVPIEETKKSNAVSSEGLGDVMQKFDQSLEKINANPGSNSHYEIKLLRKDFEAQLKQKEHEAEIKELKHLHTQEIKELQDNIEELKEEVEYLEEDLDDKEGELSGLQNKEHKASFGEVMLARVVTQAGENLLKNNPNLLKIGLGLTDEEIKEVWKNSGEQKKIESKGEDNSSFETTATDEYAGLDEKQVQGIKDVVLFLKQLPFEDFRKIYTIFAHMQDRQSEKLNHALADQFIHLIKTTQEKEE